MFEYGYNWFGLNNTYNAKMFAQLGNTDPVEWTGNQTEFLNEMSYMYKLNNTEMMAVYNTFVSMTTYLSGGQTAILKNKDLITGFYSTMGKKVCDETKANIFTGDAIYYSPFVTPSITNYIGDQAE